MAGTILPPGADYAHAISEVSAYDNLAYEYPQLTEDTLFRYFKNAGFGPEGTIAREYSPRPGVKVLRDERWGVPHVYGDTDEDVWFGAGYVSAEDRLPIMDLLRAIGRGEAFELLETTPAWMADAEWVRLYGYTEEEFQEQLARLPKEFGDDGEEVLVSMREFIDGVNDYVARIHRAEVPLPDGYREIGRMPAPWRETDIVAVTTVIRAMFGAGGGGELRNAQVLGSLEQEFGLVGGRGIYEDFRNRNNHDGPSQTGLSFPYMQRDESQIVPAANVRTFSTGKPGVQVLLENLAPLSSPAVRLGEIGRLADRATIRWDRLKLDTPLGSIDLRPRGLSNAVVVGASRSATGRPMLLGGPQTGYFSPEILMEVDLHGPTIHARGAAFPGISMFVLLGRSSNAAWTATAGGGDMIDTRIELLCEADGSAPTEHSTSYMFRGSCEPMNRRLVRSLPHLPGVAGYRALPDIYAERTIHGPVIARGTVDGRPVAVARQRSTYGREADSAIAFLRLNRNEACSGEEFVKIMADVNLSTNWMYAGAKDIAYMHGGLYPRRPASVDPDLPVWGTGEWEWDGFLTPAEHPHEINPASGFMTSWNNRPGRDWGAADSKWGWSSLYRSRMLHDRVAADDSITVVELVQLMEEAGLTDMRASYDLPLALRVLNAGTAPSARAAQMKEILSAWVASGALRRDSDHDGRYEHGSAVAIMDQWWSGMIHSIYDPVLGDVTRIPLGFDNAPGPTGSAYQDGFYGQIWTDLSQVLEDAINSTTSQVYCGSTTAGTTGTLSDCAGALWASLDAAGAALAGSQGEDPSAWDMNPELERIRFLPGAAISMHWVNRPTFQQLTVFGE
ncbi:MAG: penicillin acylase family protein [Actinomycetota bacterium]